MIVTYEPDSTSDVVTEEERMYLRNLKPKTPIYSEDVPELTVDLAKRLGDAVKKELIINKNFAG